MKQPDLFGAMAARDEGMERVWERSGPWKDRAKIVLKHMYWTAPITGEDIRHTITDAIGPPHDPHVWGALTNWALHQGVICKHGRDKMKDRRSHARETPTYIMGAYHAEDS